MATPIESVCAGDPTAIESFYHEYAAMLLRYVRNKLPQEDAQEIVNDVFLDAIDALPNLRKETNIKAWLYKIAHNKVVNYYRKKKLKSFLFSQFPYLKILSEEMHEPEFQFEKRELKVRLHIVLEQLSEKYRQILHMHYIEDMPVKHIAITLNLSFKATESRLYRARQQFIKHYQLIT